MTTQYDQLLALINQQNVYKFPLTLDNIAFSNPTPVVGINGNTKITVSSLAGYGFEGTVDVYYNRISFQELDSVVWLFSDTEFTSDSIVTLLNTDRNCIFLASTDIEPITVPGMRVGDVVVLSLVAKPNSINWVDQTSLSLIMGFPSISNDLNNLVNFVFPTQGYLS
jgi:hypothetical protein